MTLLMNIDVPDVDAGGDQPLGHGVAHFAGADPTEGVGLEIFVCHALALCLSGM